LKRKACGKRAVVAIAVFLALGIQLGATAPSGAGAPLAVHSVTRFSDGSGDATFFFTGQGGQATASIALPRTAYVTSAALNVRGLQGLDGSYPADAWVGTGHAGDHLWTFGEGQPGAGRMGSQQDFSDGSDAADIVFPPGGGTASSTPILIPGDAVIRSASVQLQGGEGPHGPPTIFGTAPQQTLPAWNTKNGRAVLAEVEGSNITITEVDPYTGTEFRHRELVLGPAGTGRIADFQFSSETETAAMLLPGSGIHLLELGTGVTTRFYDDGRASTISTMSLGGGWIAAAGTGWAGVTRLPSGTYFGLNSSSNPGAFAGRPVGVDYDPDRARLFVASDTGPGKASFWVMGTAGGSLSHVDVSGLPASISAMRYLPGKDELLVGLAGTGPGAIAGPVMVLDIASMALGPNPLFSAGQWVDTIQLEGDRAAMPVSAGEFVVADLQNGSYDVLPITYPDGGRALAWSFDFTGERLLAATSAGSMYILDFKSGRGHPLARGAAVPASINAACSAGNVLVFGTGTGIVAQSKGGTPRWRLDCGAVSSLALGEGATMLAAGANEGWRLDSVSPSWGFSSLNLTVMDIQSGPSSARSWTVPLEKGEGRSEVSALALDSAAGHLFFGVSSNDQGGGLRMLNLSTGAVERFAPRTLGVESVALSRDMKTLYAGSRGSGLLVIDLPSGARRTITGYNGSGLLSPLVSSLMVDEFGRLLAGQAEYGQYGGGLTVFGPDMTSTRNYSAQSSRTGGGMDVRSIARDPRTMRIFLGLGNGGGLSVIDENANTQMGVPGLFGGSTGASISIVDLSWNPQDRTLLCAGGGLGFCLQWAGDNPQNVALDIGADGTVDWSAPAKLESVYLPDIVSAIQGAIGASGGGPSIRSIPVRLSSSSAGLLGLRSLAVTYEWSRPIDILGYVRSSLASRAPGGSGTVNIFLESHGGGLSLFNLSVTYLDDSPPRTRALPQVASDTIARAPTVLDLGRYFTDSNSPPNELTYTVRPSKAPAGVEMSVVFSRYLMIDSRGSAFRGTITLNVTATDSSGLSTSRDMQVRVARSDEYAPPQPVYFTFLWVSAVVLAAVGGWILILYFRVRRAKKD
jgi:hypothetical protein